jgi:hypothetical protein
VKLANLIRAAAVALCLAALAPSGQAQAGTPDAQLLRMYQPVTRFDPEERFRPTSVQSFLADADLERFIAGTWVVADSDPEPGDLPGPGTGIWRLNQDSCTPTLPLGGLSCYAGAWDEGSGSSVVYGRVARTAGRIVLQYWYFYYDNTYSYRYPPSDFIWQAHEGDWEVVNVVLSDEGEPLLVGYSQHCLGERRDWQQTPRWDDTHPIVYVGVGSHANFFSPGVHPINLSCLPPAAIQFFLSQGLPLPADVASAGAPQAGQDVTRIAHVDDDVPNWIAFPGFWGELEYFHAPGIGTLPFGTSPIGPAYHAVWQDPLATLATWPAG